MDIFGEDLRNQKATYWAPEIPNEFGGYSFSAVPAQIINCRWEDKVELFRDTQGQERRSSSVVYADRELEPGGYLVRGVQGAEGGIDPRLLVGAEIIQVFRSPSLAGDEQTVKVML